MKLILIEDFSWRGRAVLDKVNGRYYLLLGCVHCNNVAMLPREHYITVENNLVTVEGIIFCDNCERGMTITKGEIEDA